MIGSIIGAGLGLATSAIGGALSASQNAKAEEEMRKQKGRNDAWYDRRYNEDYADTAAGQNMMRIAQDYARENWKKAHGASVVGGASESASALAKEQGNKLVGDTLANMSAQDTARKMNVDNIHQQQENNYSAQQVALAQQKAKNTADVASAASDALFQAGSAFEKMNTGGVTSNLKNTAGDATENEEG